MQVCSCLACPLSCACGAHLSSASPYHIVYINLETEGTIRVLAVARSSQGWLLEKPAVIVFNGSGYSRTFSAESSNTIYLLADTDNFLLVRKTFVYYGPTEDALQTDTTLRYGRTSPAARCTFPAARGRFGSSTRAGRSWQRGPILYCFEAVDNAGLAEPAIGVHPRFTARREAYR